MLIDKFNRRIDYLRISVTDRCNLRCEYCMPEEGVCLKKHSDMLSYEEIINICKTASELGIRKIKLTGGEPLVRKDICVLVKGISQITAIEDLSMTTNGIHLREYAAELKRSGLDRVNVSIDSLDPSKYTKITRGGDLNKVLAGIDEAVKVGLTPVKINVVYQIGFNDNEVEDFMAFADRRGVKIQFIRQMSLKNGKPKETGMNCQKPPNCASCNRIRLTADGKFKPCLFSDSEMDVKKLGIKEAILMAIEGKPEIGQTCSSREMVQIGG